MFVAFLHGGQTHISRHLAMPFGASASVHAWDRIGALICHIARRVLHLPILRYVDDFFAIEAPELIQHSMECFARLVRCLLGPTAVAANKLLCGMPLDILGLTVSVDAVEMKCWPMPDKVQKWFSRIATALSSHQLSPSVAGKLAGALSWASQHMFFRLGKAMLQPLYKRQHSKSRSSSFSEGSPLDLCLKWWSEVLSMQLLQAKPFTVSQAPTVHLFADARGQPPRLAAVLLIDGAVMYIDWAPPTKLMQMFQQREDTYCKTFV